jgi:ferredoxin-NADP reductase
MTLTSEKISLTISRIRELTPRIRAYELRSESGVELPLASGGSHIAIPVQLASGKTAVRHYSICSNPVERNFCEIAVLSEDPGRSGSHFIFNNFQLGTTLECGLPTNNFHLHADASPATLIAGGIGISPIMAMAHTLALRGRRFTLHYAGRSKIEMAFVSELQHYFPRNLHIYPANEGVRLDIMHALGETPSNTLFYACGPQKMLADIELCARMLGITKDRIQTEYFAADNSEKDTALVLELAHSNKLINVNPEQSLLSAVRDAGINVSFDCCIGDCGSCAVKILEGEAEHRDHVLSDEQKAAGFICLCVSRAKGGKLVLAL